MGIKRKIQIGIVLFITLSVLGYIYYPILTILFDVLFIWGVYKWGVKKGIKMTFTFKRKNG